MAPDMLLAVASATDEDAAEASVPSGRARPFARGTGAAPSAPSRAATTSADPRVVLGALYAAHAASIQRFLRDLLGDAALAADGTQETFARAFRGLAAVRDADRPLAWLFGIARNVSLEYRKARRVARDRLADDAALEAAPCAGRSPEAQLLGREAAALVARALAGLPEERRAALLLRVDHGLGYEEIASALGWSEAKAKVEVFRAREVLRAVLRTYEGGAP